MLVISNFVSVSRVTMIFTWIQLSLNFLYSIFSPQFCHTVRFGRMCGWWAHNRCYCVTGHLCLATEEADQNEEDFAPLAAGERGGCIIKTIHIKYIYHKTNIKYFL